MHDNDDYDAHRYDSAAGWNPDAPNAAARRRGARELLRDIQRSDHGLNPFLLSPGRSATAGPTPKPPAQLFGPLWHEGELAILFGPSAIGKSLLAVQIAAQVAGQYHLRKRVVSSSPAVLRPFSPNGQTPIPDNPLRTTARPQKVLYFDFERTLVQFTERYSAPHPLPGKLPLRHRFPGNFIRADLAPASDSGELPARFRGDMHRYLLYWLRECVEESGARVVVVDNLSYLARTLAGRSGSNVIKTLKLWSAELHLSILAVTHAKPAKASSFSIHHSSFRIGPSLADLSGSPAIADLADTVFHLAPSLLAPDLRYIKHLKSRRIETDPQTVLTCQITRGAALPDSPISSFITHNSAFPSLSFLGLAPESVHLTDPFAEPPRRTEKRVTQTPHPALPKPRSQMTTVEMLLSREYWRYLER